MRARGATAFAVGACVGLPLLGRSSRVLSLNDFMRSACVQVTRRHPACIQAAASTPPAPDRRLTPHPHPNDCQHLAHTRLPADISSAPDRQPTSCLHLSPLPFQQTTFLPNSGIFFVCWYVEGRSERLSHCKFTQARGMLHIILILE